jgi:hypothetical protein
MSATGSLVEITHSPALKAASSLNGRHSHRLQSFTAYTLPMVAKTTKNWGFSSTRVASQTNPDLQSTSYLSGPERLEIRSVGKQLYDKLVAFSPTHFFALFDPQCTDRDIFDSKS